MQHLASSSHYLMQSKRKAHQFEVSDKLFIYLKVSLQQKSYLISSAWQSDADAAVASDRA